jgi:hypothetical protein
LAFDPRHYITDLTSKISSTGETTLELDSHADTCVFGRDALILLDYNRPVIVEEYDPSLGTKTYATVSGALAYDDPLTGEVYHIVINQAIYIPHLDHHLLCPMQCRVNDVTINETPKFLVHDPTDHTHALIVKDLHNPAQTVDVTDDENFHQVLTSKVMILSVETSLNGHIRLRNIAPIDPQTLAARWMISPDRAKRTVVMTTQHGVRTCLNPTLSRRFPTNDRMLRYKQLPHTIFTDTMFALTASRQGNKMAQIYST